MTDEQRYPALSVLPLHSMPLVGFGPPGPPSNRARMG